MKRMGFRVVGLKGFGLIFGWNMGFRLIDFNNSINGVGGFNPTKFISGSSGDHF